MTYRVIIAAGGDDEAPNGDYVTVNGRRDSSGYDFDTLDRAMEVRNYFAGMFPDVTYLVVQNDWNSWENIAAMYDGSSGLSRIDLINDDADDDEPERCEDCGNDVDECGGDHTYHECADCGWSCGVPDCDECVRYSDEYGDDLCDGCYERHERSCSTEPGVVLRTRSCCGTADVHHDDISERFVCDCEAARLLADKRPVTLAHPLPTLEVA